MAYGAILEKGERFYTHLPKVFDAIGNKQNDYNWLITNCSCYPKTQSIREKFSHEYCWLSGNELRSIV